MSMLTVWSSKIYMWLLWLFLAWKLVWKVCQYKSCKYLNPVELVKWTFYSGKVEVNHWILCREAGLQRQQWLSKWPVSEREREIPECTQGCRLQSSDGHVIPHQLPLRAELSRTCLVLQLMELSKQQKGPWNVLLEESDCNYINMKKVLVWLLKCL